MPLWLISLVSVVVGGALTYVGSLHLRRLELRDAERGEVRRALSFFLGRLYIVIAILRDAPPDPPPSLPEKIQDKAASISPRVRASAWVRTQRGLRETFGDGFRDPMEGLSIAYAHLQLLPLDRALRGRIDETMDYLELLSTTRTDEVKGRWPEMRRSLLNAIEAAGAHPRSPDS
jgi:hypothetical protein